MSASEKSEVHGVLIEWGGGHTDFYQGSAPDKVLAALGTPKVEKWSMWVRADRVDALVEALEEIAVMPSHRNPCCPTNPAARTAQAALAAYHEAEDTP